MDTSDRRNATRRGGHPTGRSRGRGGVRQQRRAGRTEAREDRLERGAAGGTDRSDDGADGRRDRTAKPDRDERERTARAPKCGAAGRRARVRRRLRRRDGVGVRGATRAQRPAHRDGARRGPHARRRTAGARRGHETGPLPDGTMVVGRRVARCIAVRSGPTDKVGEGHAAMEALAQVARTLAGRGEAMLLDRRSLGIAHAGGATNVDRHRTLAMHELLRGRRAVTIVGEETGVEEGPGTSLPGVRDEEGTLYVGVGEHADATTVCTMLSVQQARRRRGQKMVLYERTDAFSQYEATAKVPFVGKARTIVGNGGGERAPSK